jgi:hypothetical protein
MTKTLFPNYKIVEELFQSTSHKSLDPAFVTEKYVNPKIPYFQKSLDDILINRQSTRFFNEEKAISYHHLISILEKNMTFQKNNWKRDFEDGISLEQYVLVRRVKDNLDLKSDRIYKYSEEEKMKPLNNLLLTEIIDDIFLQREFSQAAAIIIFVGNLEDTVKLYGARGYNSLLKKSGAIAEYSWLQSIDQGYVGTVFAGILPRGLAKISDLDGYRKCQMFAFAFGHPFEHFERR